MVQSSRLCCAPASTPYCTRDDLYGSIYSPFLFRAKRSATVAYTSTSTSFSLCIILLSKMWQPNRLFFVRSMEHLFVLLMSWLITAQIPNSMFLSNVVDLHFTYRRPQFTLTMTHHDEACLAGWWTKKQNCQNMVHLFMILGIWMFHGKMQYIIGGGSSPQGSWYESFFNFWKEQQEPATTPVYPIKINN